jgi:RES domain
MPELATKTPGERGLWRVARGDPFALEDPAPRLIGAASDPGIGNRFDSALGDFRVWYFATLLEGCYGETLAALRPSPVVRVAVQGDDDCLMPLGEISADWRQRRIAVRARFPEPDRPFLDVEAASTRNRLRSELPWLLAELGLDDIDTAAIRSKDRRLTRWISQWVWQRRREIASPNFAGIRFLSHLNTHWECWAVFEDLVLEEQERKPILRQDEALKRVAELYGLDIF